MGNNTNQKTFQSLSSIYSTVKSRRYGNTVAIANALLLLLLLLLINIILI
jgi:hypothetical protein